MKGVVLTGGHGTHLRPLTHTGPKQLLPLVNKPNVLYCVEDLRDAGITDIESNLALVGIYLLRPAIFPIIDRLKPSWRNELEITDAIEGLRKGGGKVKAYVVKGWWKDTGRPEDVLEANHLLLEDIEAHNDGTVEADVEIHGRVRIGKGTVVAKGTVIRGPVAIGADCVIGPNTYIGPYTSVGDGSRIVGADIEASIVIGEAIIETPNKIVNSLIGRHTTIRSAEGRRPKGTQLVVGEGSTLFL